MHLLEMIALSEFGGYLFSLRYQQGVKSFLASGAGKLCWSRATAMAGMLSAAASRVKQLQAIFAKPSAKDAFPVLQILRASSEGFVLHCSGFHISSTSPAPCLLS